MATRKKGEAGGLRFGFRPIFRLPNPHGFSNVAVVDQYQYTTVHTMAKAKELREIPFERSKDVDHQKQGVAVSEQNQAWITVR